MVPLRNTFSRPVNSGWNPVPTSNSDAIRPRKIARPDVGSVMPAYEQCAAGFQEESGVTVTITQYAWDDYWSGITNGFVAGTGPDVFTNHLSKYPEFVTQGQL